MLVTDRNRQPPGHDPWASMVTNLEPKSRLRTQSAFRHIGVIGNQRKRKRKDRIPLSFFRNQFAFPGLRRSGRRRQAARPIPPLQTQRPIFPAVPLRKPAPPIGLGLHLLPVQRHQSRDPPAQSRHLRQVSPYQTPVPSLQLLVALLPQRQVHPTVYLRFRPSNRTSSLPFKNAWICSRLNFSDVCAQMRQDSYPPKCDSHVRIGMVP